MPSQNAQIILDAAKVSAASCFGGKQRTEAGAAVAASAEGRCLPPKHDAALTFAAPEHYLSILAYADAVPQLAGAVLKPQGGNCAVLP